MWRTILCQRPFPIAIGLQPKRSWGVAHDVQELANPAKLATRFRTVKRQFELFKLITQIFIVICKSDSEVGLAPTDLVSRIGERGFEQFNLNEFNCSERFECFATKLFSSWIASECIEALVSNRLNPKQASERVSAIRTASKDALTGWQSQGVRGMI